MFRRRILPALLGSVVLASLAAAEHKTKEEDGPAAQLSKAPVAARSLRNPFAADENAAAAGRKLYEKHCAHCHGADAGVRVGCFRPPSVPRGRSCLRLTARATLTPADVERAADVLAAVLR